MKTASLRDLWVDELKDLYNAEQQIIKTLPKMAKTAESSELQQAFEEHLEQTRGHVERLQEIFESLDEPVRGKKCKGIEGIINEGKETIAEGFPENVMDAAIIGAAQKVEHYEIAAYGTARTHAQSLGEEHAAELLQETLNEEEDTDKRLTEIASSINPEAVPVQTSGNGKPRGGRRRQTARR